MKKKLLSLLVVICMIIGMLPMIAMAAGETHAIMEFATGVGTKDNSLLVPGEAAYFKVTAPDADGNTYLTKGDYASDYDVAYINEEVPTLYLNGAYIQNDLPFVLYAYEAGTTTKVATDLKVVIQADTTIHSTCTKGEDNGPEPWDGIGGAITMHPMGGEVTITSVGDAKLTASAITAESYSGPEGIHNSGSRGSVIAIGYGDLVLMNANIDVDFSKNPDSESTCPSGIGVYGGNLTINGGNVRVGLGLRDDDYEMNSPLWLEEESFGGVAHGGKLKIEGGANVLILQDNNARPIRYSGKSVEISDSNVEIASENPNPQKTRVAFGDGPVTFKFTKEYTAVGTAEKPEIENNVATLVNPAAEIADLTADANIDTYYYFKVTVKEAAPKLPKVAARTLTLDDVNDINFLFLKSDLEGLNINDLTVYFTMDRQEGYQDRVVEAKLEPYDKHGGIYYRVKFNNVAAKEMCDNIIVVVKDSEGNAVTEEYTTTMAKSIWDLYNTYTGEDAENWQNLCVAMARYGAAAQIALKYNTTDLASKYFDEC